MQVGCYSVWVSPFLPTYRWVGLCQYLVTCPACLLCRRHATCTDDLVTSWGIQCCSDVLCNWVEVNAEIEVWVVLCFYSIVIHRQVIVELGPSVDAKSAGSGIDDVGDAHAAQLCLVTSNIPGRKMGNYICLLSCNAGKTMLLMVSLLQWQAVFSTG